MLPKSVSNVQIIVIVLIWTHFLSVSCENTLHAPHACEAYLHYWLSSDYTYSYVERIFGVESDAILIEDPSPQWSPGLHQQSLFVRVNCSQTGQSDYSATAPYSASISIEDYQGLVWPQDLTQTANGSFVHFFCRCSARDWNLMITYNVSNNDTVQSLCQRFKSNQTAFIEVNNITDANNFLGRKIYYIPTGSVPGVATVNGTEGVSAVGRLSLSWGKSLGIACASLFVFAAFLILLIQTRTKFFWKNNAEDITAHKPLVFTYEEILAATGNFMESNLLGQGAYGPTYFGILQNQEVAIKKMKGALKAAALMELYVNHENVVKLIGYSSTEGTVFLVYEFMEHRSLSEHLHNLSVNGYPPLAWATRVQIALDAARGLEAIHRHKKPQLVHRDVKTSNILLNSSCRAKIADFGLADLVEQEGDEASSMVRLVGTFGYLAPEYLLNGRATTKSDAYAFGVVLFELITGQQAISKNKAFTPSTPERRSLISLMVASLKESSPTNLNKLREVIDPQLGTRYPSEALYKMAVLGKHCVADDPQMRPGLSHVVLSLWQIQSSSIKWEATLGNDDDV